MAYMSSLPWHYRDSVPTLNLPLAHLRINTLLFKVHKGCISMEMISCTCCMAVFTTMTHPAQQFINESSTRQNIKSNILNLQRTGPKTCLNYSQRLVSVTDLHIANMKLCRLLALNWITLWWSCCSSFYSGRSAARPWMLTMLSKRRGLYQVCARWAKLLPSYMDSHFSAWKAC